MSLSLIDTPRCLSLDVVYVGDPAPAVLTSTSQGQSWMEGLATNSTALFRRQAVRECLDLAATLREYRRQTPGETWMNPAGSERRLLAQVNAILALGVPAVSHVLDLAVDPDVPDPGRIFAGLLVLGCIEGREWLGAAHDLFARACERDRAEAGAAIEAAGLSPNPFLNEVLERLAADPRVPVRAAAVRALGFRAALPEAVWGQAIYDDPAVAAAALTAPLGTYDRGACTQALEALLDCSPPEVLFRLALRAAATIGLPSARARAVGWVQASSAPPDVISLLAMFGQPSDIPWVRTALQLHDPLPGLRAARILGYPDLVPDMLEILHRTDVQPGLEEAVAHVLQEMTGLPFAKTPTTHGRADLWKQHASRFDRRRRLRGMREWSVASTLAEMRRPMATTAERQEAFLELQIVTEGAAPRFNALDFVAVQIASLDRIERWMAGSSGVRMVAGES